MRRFRRERGRERARRRRAAQRAPRDAASSLRGQLGRPSPADSPPTSAARPSRRKAPRMHRRPLRGRGSRRASPSPSSDAAGAVADLRRRRSRRPAGAIRPPAPGAERTARRSSSREDPDSRRSRSPRWGRPRSSRLRTRRRTSRRPTASLESELDRVRPRLQPLSRRLGADGLNARAPASRSRSARCSSRPRGRPARPPRDRRPRRSRPSAAEFSAAGYDRTFAEVLLRDGQPLPAVARARAPAGAVSSSTANAGRDSRPARRSSSISARPRRRWPPTARLPRDRTPRPARGVLVGLGGDVAVAGEAAAGRLGRCGSPTTTPRRSTAPGPVVSIATGGLASSGTRVRRWTTGRRRAPSHHRPANGPPAATPLAHGQRRRAGHASTPTRRAPRRSSSGASAPRWLERRAACPPGSPPTTGRARRSRLARRSRRVSSGSTPLWYLTRGSGVVALLLLTATTLLGVLTTGRWRSDRWPRFAVAGPPPKPDAARAGLHRASTSARRSPTATRRSASRTLSSRSSPRTGRSGSASARSRSTYCSR